MSPTAAGILAALTMVYLGAMLAAEILPPATRWPLPVAPLQILGLVLGTVLAGSGPPGRQRAAWWILAALVAEGVIAGWLGYYAAVGWP